MDFGCPSQHGLLMVGHLIPWGTGEIERHVAPVPSARRGGLRQAAATMAGWQAFIWDGHSAQKLPKGFVGSLETLPPSFFIKSFSPP